MSRGLGTVQVALLTFLYFDLSEEPVELVDDYLGHPSTAPFRAIDTLGELGGDDYLWNVYRGQRLPWQRWWPISYLSDKERGPGAAETAKRRSDRSVLRRAAYALERRGIVATRFIGNAVDDPQLHIRITDAGIDYVSERRTLLDRVQLVRYRLNSSDRPALTRAQVLALFRTPVPPGEHDHHGADAGVPGPGFRVQLGRAR